ncbi:MAG: Ldh family oxidoreductase [SAR324 cluster bacterium]|nr:Ldh family oxidoreductase [SAR324 cluster bacterium]
MAQTFYIPPDRLRDAARQLCLASGSPEAEAGLLAERLVKANLAGHDSHGIIRLAMYMQWMRDGIFQPGQTPRIVTDNGATCLISGNRGYGQVAAEYAMDVAIDRARQHGIAGVGVTDLSHIGRLADYAITAARASMVGMVFTATGGKSVLVAPAGGRTRRMSTNPMAVGLPSDRDFPIVFDMATSAYAEGKFRVMQDGGFSSPEGLLIDPQGKPTTDPEDFFNGGAILPAGGRNGYKGYLLNFMVEVLAGLLTGGGYLGKVEDPLFNNCTMMIVIDVTRFRELAVFKEELEDLIGYMKDSPAQQGEEVLYPGELEARRETERLRTGIPLAGKTVENLQAELDRHGVGIQLAALAQAAPAATAS